MKKAFTIIELIMIIVVLGIIATIITPLVSNVINDSKKNYAERSILGYVKSIELAELDYQYYSGGSITQSVENLSIESSNEAIDIEQILIDETGKVINGIFTTDNYNCNYLNKSVKCTFVKPVVAQVNNQIIENSWEEIEKISKKISKDSSITNTSTSAYGLSLNDKKDFTVNGETLTAQIIGFNHDDKSDGIGKAGITFSLYHVMGTTKSMNSTQTYSETNSIYVGTNVGGWKDCEMRTYLNTDIYNNIDDNLKNLIKSVNKKSDIGNKDKSTIVTTSDKLWLFSFQEVNVTQVSTVVAGQGVKYAYFTNNGTRSKSSYSSWWLRSSYTYSSSDFQYISSSGASGKYAAAFYNDGVVFGFAI